jgi:hypothetical protein
MNKFHYLILVAFLIASITLYAIIRKYELKPLYIIFIGAGLTIVGGIFTAWGTFAQNEKSSKSTEEIKETGQKNLVNTSAQLVEIDKLRAQNDSLVENLAKRDKEIAAQSDKILHLSNNLVEKSDYISNHITGKGYPLLVPTALKASRETVDETVTFTLLNEGEYPLYDIQINVMDWNFVESKIKKREKSDEMFLSQSDFKKSLILVLEHSQIFPASSMLDKDRFDMRDGLLYIVLKCRSSFLHEKIAFFKKDRAVYYKFVVYDKDAIIKEWITPNTPVEVQGILDQKLARIPKKVKFTLTD